MRDANLPTKMNAPEIGRVQSTRPCKVSAS